jgi:hypothetical protein
MMDASSWSGFRIDSSAWDAASLSAGARPSSEDSTLTLDAGPPAGTVSQLFRGFTPMFLNQQAGQWYAVLDDGYYGTTCHEPGQDWGELEGPGPQWGIHLVDGRWTPMSMSRLPPDFTGPNLWIPEDVEDVRRVAGQRVTLQMKDAWRSEHPPSRALSPHGGCAHPG